MATPPKTSAQSLSIKGKTAPLAQEVVRVKSKDLLQQKREIEIDHMGRIYRLRITQHNKLILTA